MTLQDFANLGEAIGGFAVVVSLLFVGFELRQARSAYQNSLLKQQVARTIELGRDVSRNVDVWARGHSDYRALSLQDQTVFSSILYSVTLDLSEQWLLVATGKVEEELSDIVQNNVRFFLGSRGAQQWWRSQPLGLPRSFVEWVNSEILPPSTGETPAA